MDKYYLTKERLRELEGELKELKTRKRLEVAERLRTAKEYGDLAENSEYAQARDEQAQVERRIFELEELFKHAVVIRKAEGISTVRIGSIVTAKKGSDVFRYEIVGSNETKPEEGKISNESPLGRAFLGRKVGDSVTIDAPSGQIVYQITKVE